jgi:hypothetical protein
VRCQDFPHSEYQFAVVHVFVGEAALPRLPALRDALMDNGYLLVRFSPEPCIGTEQSRVYTRPCACFGKGRRDSWWLMG